MKSGFCNSSPKHEAKQNYVLNTTPMLRNLSDFFHSVPEYIITIIIIIDLIYRG